MKQVVPEQGDAPIPTSEERRDITLSGIGVAPGIAIGPVFLFERDILEVEKRPIPPDAVATELDRFERAVYRAERELQKISSIAHDQVGKESADIFEAQALMLRDQALYRAVTDRITQELWNAEYAVHAVMTRHRQLMKASESEYLRERAQDLQDVQDRLIRHLRRGKALSSINDNTIVVAENLTAADMVLFSRKKILGCAMDQGGPTSHVSILARALNVPTVFSLHNLSKEVREGDTLILDGVHGNVILNPSEETLTYWRQQQVRYQMQLDEHLNLTSLPSETLDGERITLRSNLEFEDELNLVKEFGGSGIGLFRTEMVFLMQGKFSYDEEEQFKIYRRIVSEVSPAITTFRVLDLGGDKVLPLSHREQNPFLGWRGIRILLDRKELLLPQLRAMLRAAAVGPSRILLPMITNLSEVHAFRRLLEQAKQDLLDSGTPFNPTVPIGIMVEVPAVALMADLYAQEADFFSIGSNDLTQYVLAVDRGNDLVSRMYNELHPGVLALIKMAVDAARRAQIPVSLCGELAADPRAIPILIGLGLKEFSIAPRNLPEIKRVVRSLRCADAVALARTALKATSAEEVTSLADAWINRRPLELGFMADPIPAPAIQTPTPKVE